MLNPEMFLDSDTENDVMQDTVVAFTSRHLTEAIEGQVLYREKYHKEKIKTLTVALVICLNIDIDPPDVQKIPPFSRVEAWVDPTDANSLHALGNIGKNLQAQYERWQPRARYKQCLDPTLDDVKKLCLSLRRNAKDDRILFHYNGHGVPRPTENGEIWVFNTKFTKYIPLSLYDLQRWLGAPTVYVLDCQNAGRIIHMYEVFCERRKAEAAVVEQRQMECDGKTDQSETSQYNHQSYSGSNCPNIPNQATLPSSSTVHVVSMENTFMLAACGKDEDLPQNPNLPADLFTACLTTPIRMALRWHWLRHQEYFPGYLDETLLDRIPGSHSNRMSLLGEINWIFTAVTDTIAWCSFPLDIFQKLFRQDLLIASLFRNFLLAERIMKYYGCHPISAPLLLPTYKHNMWDAWDHTVDRVIHYLPKMLKIIEGGSLYTEKLLPIINPNSNTVVNHNNSGLLMKTVNNNYPISNTITTTNNNSNNGNNNNRIPGQPCPTGNIPLDVCTNLDRHFSTQQQTHAIQQQYQRQEIPQGIHTGLLPLKQVKATVPSVCVYPPNKSHGDNNIPISQQTLTNTTNPDLITNRNVASTVTLSTVCNVTVSSTFVSKTTTTTTTTTAITKSKAVVTADPLENHSTNQMIDTNENKSQLNHDCLQCDNNNHRIVNVLQCGLPPDYLETQHYPVTVTTITTNTVTTATLNTSSRTSELVSKSKVFKQLNSDSVAPPPGFNNSSNNNADKLQSQPVTTMLADSDHHPTTNTTVEFISNDTNDSNKDLNDRKSTFHRVKEMNQLEIVEFTKQNTNESHLTNDDDNDNEPKFLTTTTATNNNDSSSIVQHTLTNEIEKSIEQVNDDQVSKTTVPRSLHPSSQQHQSTSNPHHDHHHQKDSSSLNNKVQYSEHEDNQNNEIVSTGSQMKQSNQIKLESKTNFNLNNANQEKICHENSDDNDDDADDDDDSTDNSESDDDDDDDIDVDEEDDDDDDEEEEEEEEEVDEDDHDGGNDKEEEDNRAEQYKCSKTTLNVPNTIGSTTKIMNTAVTTVTTTNSTNSTIDNCSTQLPLHPTENCHESNKVENQPSIGITDSKSNLSRGISNRKLMNKKHETHLSHSISCSELYTHTNYNNQHTSQPQITRQKQQQQQQQRHHHQHQPHSKLTHEQVNIDTNNENNTTNSCQQLPPGVVVENKQTSLKLKNNNHDTMVTTEKVTESTKLLNITCQDVVPSETNDQTQKELHVHLQQQNIEDNVVVSAMKCKLRNDPPSLEKQTENFKNPGNSRIFTPVKPRQPPMHTQYPHGYEKLYLLPNSGDIPKVTGACRYRVNNNHYSNKSTTVSQQLEGPITTTALPSTQTKPIKQYLDSRTCTKLLNANDNSNNRVILPNNVNYQNEQYLDPSKSQLNNYSDKLLPPPSSNQRNNTSSTLPPLSHCQQSLTNQLVNSTVSTASTTAATTTTATTTTTVFSGSVIGGSGPSSFFTSQMTAFKIWLQTADERRPVATQLPILLQILLSQSHRIRAMQLLSEFLDLGPWAVAHCLTVGIFPYIVRLFHSPVSEVKPYLVFIWGKIIASAQTEFGRNDSVRDFGYKYFIACLSDTENLTPLTRTITAFALAKMLEKDESEEPDPFFQDVYLKQNFLPIVQTQLFDNTPTDNEEMLIRMRLWLILALAKLWCKNDEARWFGIRHNLPEVLLAYLNDISPEVRAATVYALGNLIENQTTDSSKQNHADQISHEIGGQLVKYSSRDACPLVRCIVVEAFRGLIKQFESQLCAIGIQYIQEIYHKQSQSKSHQNYTKLSLHSITSCSTKRPMRHSTISIVTPPGGSGNGGSGGLHISRQLELTSNHINVHGSWFLTKSSNREVDPQHNYNYKTHLINTQSQASPILRKSVFNPGSVFFTGSGNTPSTNIYVQFWLTLVQLAQDPYPEVSRLATILIQYLYGKIREKAEFQAIGFNSPNNNDDNDKFITNDDTTLIPSLNTSLSALNASFTISNTSTDNVSSAINELNRAADNINSCRSENTFVKESSSNSITPITTTSGLQMTTTNPSSSSLIHSAQFPGRRYQQTDQRLRVSVTNSPQLPNTIMSNNTVTCGVPATTTTDNSGNNGNYLSSLDIVHTQFFAWSCRWFTRPLLSKYGQLNNGQSKSQTTSKNSFDYEPVSLGTISTDPKAVAYTDRVNRLKKQRKISHLGRLQWERIAGQISHSLITSTINANTTTTTINRNISVCNPTPSYNTTNNNISSIMSRSRISLRSNDSGDSNINDSLDDCCLHPVAFYHHPLNHRINNSSNDTFCSISSQVKFHPYQPHLVMINSDRKGVVIHSTKNLKLLHSINTFSAKSSLFPEFPSTIDGYSRVGCVTDIEFINADEEESLLLTATDDGYIRIWRNYTHHLGQDPEILTAWNGITDLYQTDYPVGVVVHWSQHANQLMVSGDTRIIRIWDCLCESKLRDINTGSDTSVTCLTKSIDNHLLAAGFNDGGIRVWDVRVPSMNHISCNNIGGSSSISNDNLIFNSQADTARIFKVVFSSTNRLYAVGAMGGIGAWHLSFPNENNNTTPTTITSNTSLLTTSLNSSNNGSSTRHDHNNLSNHPRRYISTVVRSSTNNSINNSSTTRRFRRLPCPPRLSLPMNSSVNCADLLVNLSSPHAHLALAGTRGQSSISLHRIQDGSLHSSIKNFNNTTTNNNTFGREQFGTPVCCAFHPNEPLIAAGFHDRTLALLNVQNKSINKEV